MKSAEDRRAKNVPRIPLTTLVDICTQGEEPSPFQGESANVSGRGMHVKTSYLPEIGEELVCRLEHDGQEILVEGRVAWRAEGSDSGEFGIQFTALDADSADILQSLGHAVRGPQRKSASLAELTEEEEEMSDSGLFSEGSRVKLHIDGLGAPMKACVHQGTVRKLKVGSSLEFLKVGRALQVEDLGAGETRGASVDSVNVVINPATSVPELVVQLRYEGVSPTPPPTRVAASDDRQVFRAREAATDLDDHEDDASVDLSDDEPAPWEPAAEAIKARLGGAMASAGQAAQKAGGLFSTFAKSAKSSMAQVAERTSKEKSPSGTRLRSQSGGGIKRRQTSRIPSRAAPAHLRSGIHDLGLKGKTRPMPSARPSKSEPVQKPPRRVAPAAIFGGACLLFAGSAFALRSWGDSDAPAEKPTAAAQASSENDAARPAPPLPAVKTAKKEAPEGGIVAEVPLFGPQAMAVKPAEEPETEVDIAEAEKRAAAAAVEDESWDEAPSETKVEESKPWGRGRLYLPTIHRIRLDGVGESLAGAINPDGFTVVIPGRKAMESGKTIEKRDKRIIAVETNNGARGAEVKFEFRGSVPPYRVRLRKDFVEFLISAPEETVAKL